MSQTLASVGRGFRQVRGLLWARRSTAPKHLPTRLTGSQAAGIRFQKALGKSLREVSAKHGWALEEGPWFEYEDAGGFGRCQPDFLLLRHDGNRVVLECKLTATPLAWEQMAGLYCPVVEEALGGKLWPLQVAKNLHPSVSHYSICGELEVALAEVLRGRRVVWHSLGHIWGI